MTTFPDIDTAFQDGVQPDKADMRDLGNATAERIQRLPADYSGETAGAPVIVNDDQDGIEVADATSIVDFAGAETRGQQVRAMRFTTSAVAASAGTGTLNMNNGCVFVVTLSANLNSNGLTLSNDPEDYSEIIVKLLQNGTGGYTIAGGTNVSAGFDSGDFTFPTEITWPTGANKYVVVAGIRFSNSEKYRMLLVDRDA